MGGFRSIPVGYRNSACFASGKTIHFSDNLKILMDQDRTPFGLRLFESREATGLTQMQAAERVGMSQGTLAEAEITGKRSGYTSQLAALYGVSAEWLATGKGDKRNLRYYAPPQLPDLSVQQPAPAYQVKPLDPVIEQLESLSPDEQRLFRVEIEAAFLRKKLALPQNHQAAPPAEPKKGTA